MGIMTVVPMTGRAPREIVIDEEADRRCRRLAIQLAAQLPDDPEEARTVLDHTRTLLDGFLAVPGPV